MDTKKLRQKILDLAIHGKLVPQDPNDEPASVLLERIRAEKERLVKEGKIKKSKAAKTSDTPHYEQMPFEIPSSWAWTTLYNITTIIGDGLHGTPQYDSSGDYYFINGNNLLEHKIRIKEDTKRVSEKEYLKYQKPLNETTILVSINGTIGNIGTYNGEKVVLGKSACYFNISSLLHKVYFCYLLESDYFLKYALNSATGSTIKNVPLKAINDFFVPLPPLAEQERIVCEIKRWFALIDQIEQGKVDLQATIKQAKSKILDLAIHGKLVPQHPNDEPASELLKRINPAAEITCDNGQYGKVPVNWCITCIKNAFLINPRNKAEDVNNAGFVPMTNICDGYFNRFTYETKKWAEIKTGFTHFADGDIAVAKISPCLENRKSMVLKNLPNGIGAGTTELHVFRPLCVIQSFGLWFFKSDYFVNQCVGTFNGVVGQQRVGKNIVEDILFPLPPLAEQHRIVAKIEELFSSLDNIQKALEV